ncbi:hypothetical protein RDV84_04660 [Lysobacter yananisis]|uniref:Diguanylate cyclase n=1 Tax=Lysobacter yananisis TaxID=1003114 RepID=A0ABY9PB06_9GAMM|nr:hypothetical protein [Lysobacter yananisis]WMT04144.1 hypothetical protein RDV84_04660 [Lysobacter yananisis]
MSVVTPYVSYLLWLIAGYLDFACHRRTQLPQTSGLRESALHLAQLALLAVAMTLGLALTIGPAVFAALVVLVASHAVLGFLDTRQAYGRREIRPFEQHLHSVLDLAPVAALWWTFSWWYRADAPLTWRDPPAPTAVWITVIAPALLLCVTPALLELRAALAVARARRRSEPARG